MVFRSIFGDSGGTTPAAYAGLLLKTRQTTCYHVGDDGDCEKGLAESYTVNTTGAQSGTTAIDVPYYVANTLLFVAATREIKDAIGPISLASIYIGDTIVVSGSVSNDGVYTIATDLDTGDALTTNEALVDEEIDENYYVTIFKRAAVSNNTVLDNVTGLTWLRYTTGGPVQKVGPVSDGKLIWYDVTNACFVVHDAASDLRMTSTGIKIVGGAAKLRNYFAGMVIVCSGFANAVNNLPGYVISTVAVNGADLDLTLQVNNNTLVAEGASGSRTIKAVCGSIFAYAAAANVASLGGYTDWRVPNVTELKTLCDMEAPNALPNATAFPSWSSSFIVWSSEIVPSSTTNAIRLPFSTGVVTSITKTTRQLLALVRGG